MQGKWQLRDALIHFGVVGLGFALAVGWALTIIVNTLVGNALEAALAAPPTDYYLGSLLLSATSIGSIGLAEIVGNRLYQRRLISPTFCQRDIHISTALFSCVVIAFNGSELGDVTTRYLNNLSYFYNHPSEFYLALSLPVGRLILMPTLYFGIARKILDIENHRSM